MFENIPVILADAVVDPIDMIINSDGFIPVVAAVAVVVFGAVVFLLKKKK